MDEIYIEQEEYIDLLMAKKAVQRVRELHKDDGNGDCTVCMQIFWSEHKVVVPMSYPCPTIKALDGE